MRTSGACSAHPIWRGGDLTLAWFVQWERAVPGHDPNHIELAQLSDRVVGCALREMAPSCGEPDRERHWLGPIVDSAEADQQREPAPRLMHGCRGVGLQLRKSDLQRLEASELPREPTPPHDELLVRPPFVDSIGDRCSDLRERSPMTSTATEPNFVILVHQEGTSVMAGDRAGEVARGVGAQELCRRVAALSGRTMRRPRTRGTRGPSRGPSARRGERACKVPSSFSMAWFVEPLSVTGSRRRHRVRSGRDAVRAAPGRLAPFMGQPLAGLQTRSGALRRSQPGRNRARERALESSTRGARCHPPRGGRPSSR
jgi:hypothetical protein